MLQSCFDVHAVEKLITVRQACVFNITVILFVSWFSCYCSSTAMHCIGKNHFDTSVHNKLIILTYFSCHRQTAYLIFTSEKLSTFNPYSTHMVHKYRATGTSTITTLSVNEINISYLTVHKRRKLSNYNSSYKCHHGLQTDYNNSDAEKSRCLW